MKLATRPLAFSAVLGIAACAERSEPTRAPDRGEVGEEAVGPAEAPATTEPPAPAPAVEPAEPASPPAAAEPEPASTPVEPLVGRYRFSGGEKQRKAVARAIEDVVRRLGVLSRGIARRRLTAANAIPRMIEIAGDGDLVTVVVDERTYTARIGGEPVRVRGSDGKPSKMRFRMRGASLEQVFDAAEGDRINVFTPRENGGITLEVRITSPKLPAAVSYRLSFRPMTGGPVTRRPSPRVAARYSSCEPCRSWRARGRTSRS